MAVKISPGIIFGETEEYRAENVGASLLAVAQKSYSRVHRYYATSCFVVSTLAYGGMTPKTLRHPFSSKAMAKPRASRHADAMAVRDDSRRKLPGS